jgi:ferredoxin
VFPEFEVSGSPLTYVVEVSAEKHPLGALSMAPGARLELQKSTILDFGAGDGDACPKVTTSTTTTIFDPGNVDCVESQDSCTDACEKAADRNYVVTTQAVKNGRACVGATDCRAGEGACPFTAILPTPAPTQAPAVESTVEDDDGTGESGDDGGPNIGVIAGAAAGGVVVILIIVAVVCRRGKSDAGLPAPMKSEFGMSDERAVQNPMYEDPQIATDGYMEVSASGSDVL